MSILQQVEEQRKVKYSTENTEHEAMLSKLWAQYKPQSELDGRISERWKELGFQGDDPSTDFRGMGILGLEQLLYFAVHYPDEARNCLLKSNHPKYEFSYAIVGINITALQYSLTMKRTLRTHFYNQHQPHPSIHDYHELYCYFMSDFIRFWYAERPVNVMDFGRIRDKFYRHVHKLLKRSDCTLRTSFHKNT